MFLTKSSIFKKGLSVQLVRILHMEIYLVQRTFNVSLAKNSNNCATLYFIPKS